MSSKYSFLPIKRIQYLNFLSHYTIFYLTYTMPM